MLAIGTTELAQRLYESWVVGMQSTGSFQLAWHLLNDRDQRVWKDYVAVAAARALGDAMNFCDNAERADSQ